MIRRSEYNKDIPLIVVSTNKNTKSIESAKRAGANEYYTLFASIKSFEEQISTHFSHLLFNHS